MYNDFPLVPLIPNESKHIVDLTDDEPEANETLTAGLNPLICKYCYKQFLNQITLNLHVAKRHPSVKLPYRCGDCPAKYSTEEELATHQEVYHVPIMELGIPVVDLTSKSSLTHLRNSGFSNYIPMPISGDDIDNDDTFGIPIISVLGKKNSFCRLRALRTLDALKIEPLKQLDYE